MNVAALASEKNLFLWRRKSDTDGGDDLECVQGS